MLLTTKKKIPNARAVYERAMEELPDSERTEKVSQRI